MKVAFVIQDLFALGAQYSTALMIRGFVKQGYTVELVVSAIHKEKEDAGDTHSFPIPSKVKKIYMPSRRGRGNILFLRKYLMHSGCDIVFAASLNYTRALGVAALGLGKNKPKLVHIEHGIAGVRNVVTLKTPRPWHFSWWRRLLIYLPFSHVLTVCQGGRDNFLRMNSMFPKDRVSVVYNPVIDEVFKEKVCKDSMHPWLKNKECPTFVAAGAHTELKGHMLLLDAFKKLSETRHVRLVLFGRGDLTDKYTQFVKDNKLENVISIAGYTDNFPAEVKSADALLVSSRTESFSLVIVEALAAGTHVISADCDYGPREILRNGKYGRLVKAWDSKAFVEAISDFIDSNEVSNPVSKDSWEPFTLEATVNRYVKALNLL